MDPQRTASKMPAMNRAGCTLNRSRNSAHGNIEPIQTKPMIIPSDGVVSRRGSRHGQERNESSGKTAFRSRFLPAIRFTVRLFAANGEPLTRELRCPRSRQDFLNFGFE